MIRSTFYGFSTALSGMFASQKGLDITGNNMANAETPGYTRQRLDLRSIASSAYSDRYASRNSYAIGQGVNVSGISQIRDPFLDMRFRVEAANLGESDAWLSGMNDVTETFDEVQKDAFMAAMADFRTQLQKLAAHAGDKNLDSAIRGSAEALTKLLNQHANQLTTIREQQEYDLENIDIPNINSILENISNLNSSITEAELYGNPSLELKDQRNQLLDQLSTYMKINVEYTPTEISPGLIIDKLTIRFAEDSGDPMNFNIPGGIDDSDTRTKGFKLLEGDQHATLSVKKNDSGITEIFSDWAKINMTGAAGGSTDIPLTFESGILKGTLDFLNKNGEFDNPPNTTRGIGYYQKTLDTFARDFANALNQANLVKNPDYTPPETSDNPQYIGGPLFSVSGQKPGDDALYYPSDYDDKITAANIGISQNWLSQKYGITNTSTVPGAGDDTSGGSDNILYLVSILDQKREFNAASLVQNAANTIQGKKGVYQPQDALPTIPGTSLKDGDLIKFNISYNNQSGLSNQTVSVALTYRNGFLYGADGTKYPAVDGIGAGHSVDGDKLTDAIASELGKSGDFADNFTVKKTGGKLEFTAKAIGDSGGVVNSIGLSYVNKNSVSSLSGANSLPLTSPSDAYQQVNFTNFPIYDTDAANDDAIFTINGKSFAFVTKDQDAGELSRRGVRTVVLAGDDITADDVKKMTQQLKYGGLSATQDEGDPLTVNFAQENALDTTNTQGSVSTVPPTSGDYRSGTLTSSFSAMVGDSFGLNLKYVDESGNLQNVNVTLTYQEVEDINGNKTNMLVAADGTQYSITGANDGTSQTINDVDVLRAVRSELSKNTGVADNFKIDTPGGALQLEALTPGRKGAKVTGLDLNFNTQRTQDVTLSPGVDQTQQPEDTRQEADFKQFPPYDGTNTSQSVFQIGDTKYAFVPNGSTVPLPDGVTPIEMAGTGDSAADADVAALADVLIAAGMDVTASGTTINFPADITVSGGSFSRPLLSGSFEDFFKNIGATAALDVNTKNKGLDNHISLLNGIDDQRSSLSSVDLSEEGVNLLRYQKSFTAAARLLTALDEALDTVINKMGIVGR